MEYDPAELIALCASILSDGEVVPDEAYQIAEWLNDDPDAARNWPGSELVKPLQEIWADGSVNRRELHRLERLLISIQREWARRPKKRVDSVSDHPLPELCAADIDDVRLPSLRGTFRVRSQSESGRFYEVDLSGPSCTCPDWRTWRSNLPVGHFTRCCKHVLYVYATLPRRDPSDGWLLAFIENGWPAPPGTEWHLMTVPSGKVLFSTASDKGWANVFAKENVRYQRFGFNLYEDRWAYGSEPKGAATIGDAIRSCSEGRTNRRNDLSSNQYHSGESNRSHTGIFIAVSVVAAIVVLFAVVRLHSDQPTIKVGPASWPTTAAKHEPSPSVVQQPMIAAPSPTVQTAKPSRPLAPPVVVIAKTVRAIRTRTAHGEILIPKNATLRIIQRINSDVTVSYNGVIATIPVAETDLK